MKKSAVKAAESLSMALNPLGLTPFVILVAIFLTDFQAKQSQIRWLIVVMLLNFIVPIWIAYYLDARGIILDDTLDNKKLHRKRLVALFPILAVIAVEIAAMLVFTVHQPLFAVLLSVFISAAIAGIISYYWKISAHMTGFSLALTLLVLLVGRWILWGALFIPFIIWARLVLRRHTPLQLLGGIVIPPLVTITIFNFFHLL